MRDDFGPAGDELTEEQVNELKRKAKRVRPEDEEEVRGRFKAAEEKAKKRNVGQDLLDGLRTLYAMLTDPDYVITWKTKSLIIAALVYFISPIDAVPDVIPVLGYVDDAAVVAWVLHHIAKEVAAYREARGWTSEP